MAKLAAELSDQAILTSDNPRNENPEEIIRQMEEGVEGQFYKKLLKITDRQEAIRTAVMLAQPGDVILVAGKGHEQGQTIGTETIPFDDVAVVRRLAGLA
jgi:UDP-N-acetylmuramoyl-L-alanyl-D-glutamate--2,6-diaminopimelate ligase